ncbi:hypothetical protein [Pseudaestuariivita sp.]|uniref:hypothetical protein n=1 Tax=Pseudaestuariivita sp. TaxID=2211669 RepID=UPI00405A2D92
MAVAQTDLLCTSCGGQCAYAPETQKLTCASCGTAHDIVDEAGDPTEEFHYHPGLPHTEQRFVAPETLHSCETCGGGVVFTGAALSERCAYCDGPVVRGSADQRFQALGLIPFQVTAEDAQARARAWIAGRLAAPSNLGAIVAQGRVAGIYVPFFTFDSHEAIDYWAKYRTGGKNSVTRTVKGKMKIAFDDLLAPASPHITPLIRDGILHDFRPATLRPFTPAYLAGFAAEHHHLSVSDGLASLADDKALLIRNRIQRKHGSKRLFNIGYKTHTSGIHYRRILLPAWILHYTYNGTPKRVVVCGLHGRTFGERPFSRAKLAAYAAALSMLAIVTGWLWGAAGFL